MQVEKSEEDNDERIRSGSFVTTYPEIRFACLDQVPAVTRVPKMVQDILDPMRAIGRDSFESIDAPLLPDDVKSVFAPRPVNRAHEHEASLEPAKKRAEVVQGSQGLC